MIVPELTVIHADRAILVIDKPAGLLAVPGRGPAKQECAVSRARVQFPDLPGQPAVHRLDMATSGLLLLARGAEMQRRLSRAFAERAVHKRYVAIVHGDVTGEHGEIDLPLAADWPNRPRQQVDPLHGKPSLTRWRVLARDSAAGTTRLALEPVTGRSHQLRVHLLAHGHPIVGDALYGPPLPAARLLLHAEHLALDHPYDGRPIGFDSPAPF
jgi:tRNA pseudouridine32 synthase/23S rRNA pseudouridine746 synthase